MNEQISEYLLRIKNETLEETHTRGFTYFHHGFMPRLLEAGKIKGFNRNLLASGWLRAGEIYALNEAPKRALECINKALVLVPQDVSSLKLAIEQYNAIGKFHKAFGLINQLLDLEPDQMEFITLRQQIQDDINYDAEPEYQQGDQLWNLNELLASEQFNSVIGFVLDSNMDSIDLLKKLACAYGAVGHNANYDQVWQTIYKLDANTKYDPVDRFYQPIK